MSNDPFLQLVCDALGLMHRPFVNADLAQSVVREFYHQFRKFWDRGIPVGMGLGHLVIRDADGFDLAVHKIGEQGRPDEPYAVLKFLTPFDPNEIETCAGLASMSARNQRFRYAIVVTIGTQPAVTIPPGVTRVAFDTTRWTATLGS
jgi:hypothetical protein